jgi:hypothetical protein
MTKKPTRADLQAKAEYYQKNYQERCGQAEREIAALQDERDTLARKLNALARISDLWNQWIVIDQSARTPEGEPLPDMVQFPHGTVRKILVELPFQSHHLYRQSDDTF